MQPSQNKISFYQKSIQQAFEILETSSQGLTSEQAKNRLESYGYNVLVEKKGFLRMERFFAQFKDLLIVLLIVSGAVSFYSGSTNAGIVIVIITFLNVFIGYFQEAKAEKILESLKKLVAHNVKVIRNGKEEEIDRSELVIGDVVYLEEGDSVPADLRTIEVNHLGTNDFALTGESNPTKKFLHALEKEVLLGDRNNLLFMGTTVAVGSWKAVVIATGMNTELGKIANLTSNQENEFSPLQKELTHVSQIVTIGVVIIGGFLFFIALKLGMSVHEALAFSLGVAVSIMPQGLPAQINTGLALASARLATNNVLLKKLSAAETMGSTSMICTDKTGTLTKNEMTIQHILIGQQEYKVTGLWYEPQGSILDENGNIIALKDIQPFELFLKAWVFASNAKIHGPDEEHNTRYCLWDPTEGAVITLGMKYNFDPVVLDQQEPEVLEHGFDSIRKRMSSVRKIGNEYYAFVKGAPESLLEVSDSYYNGKSYEPLDDIHKKFIKNYHDTYANQAMRNLWYAYKKINNFEENMTLDQVESGLTFLGVATMIDPPRAEVEEAMQAAKEAKIKVMIITGDYALTAKAIALKVGLAKNPEDITLITWDELKNYSDLNLVTVFNKNAVIFSRVSPEDKLRIVQVAKTHGYVVAVTGDGINDAPALKKADIGVAMGKIWSDVAKESAEIVLLDDNFSTLVYAVREGRVIYQNLKKTTIGCFTTNSGELFTVILSLIFGWLYGWPVAMSAILILCVDLIAEMFPLMALTYDPPQTRIMSEKPRNLNDHIMNSHAIRDLVWSGIVMASLCYGAFVLRYYIHGESLVGVAMNNSFYYSSMSLAYVTMVLSQYANIFSRRVGGIESIISPYFWTNKQLFRATGFSFFCVLNIVYNPWINQFVGSWPLNLMDWWIAIVGAMIYLAFREGKKIYRRRQITEQQLLTS